MHAILLILDVPLGVFRRKQMLSISLTNDIIAVDDVIFYRSFLNSQSYLPLDVLALALHVFFDARL